jgi:hypothetical protein
MFNLRSVHMRAIAHRLSTTESGAQRFVRDVESVVGAHVSLSKLRRALDRGATDAESVARELRAQQNERRAGRTQRKKIAAKGSQRWRTRVSKLLALSRLKPPEAVAREQEAARRLLEEAAKADKRKRGPRIRVYRGGRADGNRPSKTRFRN